MILSVQCAQVAPLTGGKKDTTPPKVLSYYPENASVNFISKTVEIDFNEYIVIKDIANQFIITPQTKEIPDIQAYGKKLKIKFNEALLPNTTYKMAFGNAIVDLNEANVLQNFEYIFSTGQTIDSLKLSGKISNAFDKKPSSQILIGLYQKDSNDSVVYKEKPLYISKTNDGGIFNFNYLPNSSFKIVAIKDQNKNLMYDGSEEQIAFTKEYINPNTSSDISLLLFKETPTKNFIKKSYSPEYGKGYIIYNKPQFDIEKVSAKGLIYYETNKLQDTLSLYYINKFDTLETIVYYGTKKSDTTYIKTLTASSYQKQYKNKTIKYTLKTNISGILPFYESPTFELNVPVASKNIFESKITLIEKKDSTAKKLPFKIEKGEDWITSFKVRAEFKPETNYTLTLNKSAITDDSLRVNDSITYQFKTNALEDYAQLKMKIVFPKKENYIVILLNEKEQVIRERVIECSLTSSSEKTINYENLAPGIYFIKVIEDANKNGLFDTGDYFLNKQPESVFINDNSIKLLAGWEIENEWTIK